MAKNANSIPVVRLVGDPPKTQRKKAAAETTGEVIKLDEGVNDALRTLIRYRGDLSAMAVEALETVDLSSVALISAERMVRDTTISMPVRLHKGIKKLADERGTSMNIAVNTALAHWLAAKGAIRLR